jgi:hypothetical protein
MQTNSGIERLPILDRQPFVQPMAGTISVRASRMCLSLYNFTYKGKSELHDELVGRDGITMIGKLANF